MMQALSLIHILASIFVILLISIPLGVLCALYKDGIIDNICRVISFVGISLPSFLASLLLLYVFGVQLKWFSISGETGIKGLILPVAVLAFQCCAKLTRQVRACLLYTSKALELMRLMDAQILQALRFQQVLPPLAAMHLKSVSVLQALPFRRRLPPLKVEYFMIVPVLQTLPFRKV